MTIAGSKHAIQQFKEELRREVKIKDLSDLHWMLGIEVTRDRKRMLGIEVTRDRKTRTISVYKTPTLYQSH